MSITVATQEPVWLIRLEAESALKSNKSILLQYDNKGRLQVALINNYSLRKKHVGIKAKFVRQKVDMKVCFGISKYEQDDCIRIYKACYYSKIYVL